MFAYYALACFCRAVRVRSVPIVRVQLHPLRLFRLHFQVMGRYYRYFFILCARYVAGGVFGLTSRNAESVLRGVKGDFVFSVCVHRGVLYPLQGIRGYLRVGGLHEYDYGYQVGVQRPIWVAIFRVFRARSPPSPGSSPCQSLFAKSYSHQFANCCSSDAGARWRPPYRAYQLTIPRKAFLPRLRL